MIDVSGTEILIIDDDTWLVDELERRLIAEKCKLRRAGDAIEAMESIDNSLPDIIVLDIMLPGVNGINLLHEMQSYSDIGNIPVIVMSSSTENISRDQLKPYGVIDVIEKSIMKPGDIISAIRRGQS